MEFLAVLIIFLLVGGLGIVGTIIWIWALIDCLSNESSQGNDKVIWALVIILTHLLGAIIYFVVRRPQRKATLGR